jgi:hypothetical protein
MKNSARGELVEPCELCTTIVEGFRGSRKFSAAGFFARGACCRALHPSFVCHSEERSDEESALAFPSWSKELRKSAKQMLHFVQHDTTANSEYREGFGVL